MSRERLARLALSACPSAAREEGMLGTLLDSSAGSRRRFVRELVDLVRLGLHTRATHTASAGSGRLVADGLCLAGVWLMTLDLVTLLSWRYRVAAEALPALCFAVMVLAPRRRSPDLSGLVWLVVPVALVATFGPPGDDRSPLLLAVAMLAVILVIVLGVTMLPTDPRMAIAGAVGLSNLAITVVGIHHDTSILAGASLAAAPMAVVITIARTRQLRRQAAVNRNVV